MDTPPPSPHRSVPRSIDLLFIFWVVSDDVYDVAGGEEGLVDGQVDGRVQGVDVDGRGRAQVYSLLVYIYRERGWWTGSGWSPGGGC